MRRRIRSLGVIAEQYGAVIHGEDFEYDIAKGKKKISGGKHVQIRIYFFQTFSFNQLINPVNGKSRGFQKSGFSDNVGEFIPYCAVRAVGVSFIEKRDI